jgi:hypothetical protein
MRSMREKKLFLCENKGGTFFQKSSGPLALDLFYFQLSVGLRMEKKRANMNKNKKKKQISNKTRRIRSNVILTIGIRTNRIKGGKKTYRNKTMKISKQCHTKVICRSSLGSFQTPRQRYHWGRGLAVRFQRAVRRTHLHRHTKGNGQEHTRHHAIANAMDRALLHGVRD